MVSLQRMRTISYFASSRGPLILSVGARTPPPTSTNSALALRSFRFRSALSGKSSKGLKVHPDAVAELSRFKKDELISFPEEPRNIGACHFYPYLEWALNQENRRKPTPASCRPRRFCRDRHRSAWWLSSSWPGNLTTTESGTNLLNGCSKTTRK